MMFLEDNMQDCVQVVLDKPLKIVVYIGDHTHRVVYDGLNMVCFKCGKLDHKDTECSEVLNHSPVSPTSSSDVEPSNSSQPTISQNQTQIGISNTETIGQLGPWMVVRHKKTQPKNNKPTLKDSMSHMSILGPYNSRKESNTDELVKTTNNNKASSLQDTNKKKSKQFPNLSFDSRLNLVAPYEARCQAAITSSKACEMTPSSATKSERKFVELNVSHFPQETFNSEITNKKKNNTDEGLIPSFLNGKSPNHHIYSNKESQPDKVRYVDKLYMNQPDKVRYGITPAQTEIPIPIRGHCTTLDISKNVETTNSEQPQLVQQKVKEQTSKPQPSPFKFNNRKSKSSTTKSYHTLLTTINSNTLSPRQLTREPSCNHSPTSKLHPSSLMEWGFLGLNLNLTFQANAQQISMNIQDPRYMSQLVAESLKICIESLLQNPWLLQTLLN